MSSPAGSSPSGSPTGSRPRIARARSFANTATPEASVPTMASGAASSKSSNFGGPMGICASCGPSVGGESRPETTGFPDALNLFEHDLAHSNGMRGDFDAFVLADELQRLVERELAGGHQPDQHVGGRRAHVGDVLLLDGVDVEVLLPGVLA